MDDTSRFYSIVKHEILVTTKVTCLAFALQLGFQVLPLETPLFHMLIWILLPLVLVFGFVSDTRFYSDSVKDASIRKDRLKCNISLFLMSWSISACFFFNLDLPWNSEEDSEIVENAVKDVGRKLVLERIFEDVGNIKGWALLLFAHYFAVATFISFARTAVFLIEHIIRIMAPYIPVMQKRHQEKKSE